MRTLLSASFLGVLLGLSGIAAATPKAAGAPTTGACGTKVLPLAVGNAWTYENVASPVKIDEKAAKLNPAPIKKFVITVKSIDANKDKDTVVTLEEKLMIEVNQGNKEGKAQPAKPDERVVTSTITCNGKKFEISPEAFWFAGEPGGFVNLTFDKIERPRGGTWTLTNGGIGEAEWREDLVAHWSRKPTENSGAKPTSGKIELERKFQPQQPEMISTRAGQYKAEKLALTTTGRITLDQAHPLNKVPLELPANWVNTLWLVDGMGVMQTINSYGHEYQLVDFTPAK